MAVNTIPGMIIPAVGGGAHFMDTWISRATNKFTTYKRLVLSDKQLASGTTLYLRPEWSGAIVMIETAGITVVLPSLLAANNAQYEVEPTAGMTFTIVNTVASSGTIVKCGDATSVIKGRVNTAAGSWAAPTAIATTANTGALTNTSGTAALGDRVSVASDGTGLWYITDNMGIWAGS